MELFLLEASIQRHKKRLLQNIKKKILKWSALEYLREKKQNIKP